MGPRRRTDRFPVVTSGASPRHLLGRRLVRAAAPRGARGAPRGARPGVRRPAPPAPGRPVRAAAARQRPGGGGRGAGGPPRRGVVHLVRHRRRAPRAARPAPRRPRGRADRPHRRRALGGPARRTLGRRRPVELPVDRLGRGRGRSPAARHQRAGRPGAPTTRSAPRSPSASWRPSRAAYPCSPTRARPRAGCRCPTAGARPRPRRTSGAARRASVCCWCARARGGGTPSRSTSGSTSGRRASRTCRPRWPPPRRCRPWWPSATRSVPASAPSSTGSARASPTIPDVDVVGDPVDRLPHLVTFSCLYVDGESLVTELDRLGFGVASGSACTASTLTPSHVLAAMGALTHGNVRLSLTRDTTAGRGRRVPRGAARRGRAAAGRGGP